MDILIPKHIEYANSLVTALQNERHQKIIKWLDKNPRSSVTAIDAYMKLGPTHTSRHLNILRKAGVLIREQNGKQMLYRVHTDNMANIGDMLKNLFIYYQGD